MPNPLDDARYELALANRIIAHEGVQAALASEASGQRGDSMVRAPDTRPGQSIRTSTRKSSYAR
jgi:hypothetical protein